MRIATVNVNGIRAAMGKSVRPGGGLGEWLTARDCDVVALQEVRAPDVLVQELLAPYGYHVAHTEAVQKGRQGVALLTRLTPSAVRVGLPTNPEFDDSGRWIETDLEVNGEIVTVVSAYYPSGDAEKPEKMAEKYRFYEATQAHLPRLASGRTVVLGDFNVGHTQLDIKNWKGNLKSAGFLPEERAHLDLYVQAGWVDVARTLAGEVPGPYTWWSVRGQAFDTDTGWRIDYHWATPALASTARTSVVDRAASYAERWSDHAPLVVDYDI